VTYLRRIKHNEQGFSLVELMIAVTILGLILIPMLSMFDFGLKSQLKGEVDLVALSLGQSRLEALLAEYYQNDYKLLDPQTTSETVELGHKYTITSTAAVPSGRLQQLTVNISYVVFGQSKNIQLITRVVEY
jgi:prepilin-type N-terminal cleavage/methylation domain-containing protein